MKGLKLGLFLICILAMVITFYVSKIDYAILFGVLAILTKPKEY
tara:strand:- start:1113 stop:1244 length:132 start_codon:yes stop_codon:yes gene_type:complete